MSDTKPQYGENRPQYGEARPAPEYGEYATPDEQAQAAGLPLPSQAPAILAAVTAAEALARSKAASPTPDTARSSVPPPPLFAPKDKTARDADASALRTARNEAPGTAGRRPRRWNFIITLALLAYGAAGIVGNFSNDNGLNAQMVLFYKTADLGTYTPAAIAETLNKVITISSGVLFIITAAVSVTLLRRGRLAFYVPLIGAILAAIVSAVCIFMVLAADPAAIANITNR